MARHINSCHHPPWHVNTIAHHHPPPHRQGGTAGEAGAAPIAYPAVCATRRCRELAQNPRSRLGAVGFFVFADLSRGQLTYDRHGRRVGPVGLQILKMMKHDASAKRSENEKDRNMTKAHDKNTVKNLRRTLFLNWSPQRVRNPGRPRNTWSSQLEDIRGIRQNHGLAQLDGSCCRFP